MSQEIFNTYETPPEFPGGNDRIAIFMKKNIQYPKEAIKSNIGGRVTISFTIKANGKITNIQLLRGIGYGCDEEALRLVKLMPKWKPGTINNVPREWHYNLPIIFNSRDIK
ncbi:Gram-negative bacterial tonB protein [compost metagenome]